MPFVAPIAHLPRGHLLLGTVARWACHRLPLAWSTRGAAVRRPAPAPAAVWVAGHPSGDSICRMMSREMNAFRGAQLQVVRSVVEAVVIDVVNHLRAFQEPTDLCLHHEPVLHHPAATRDVRVVRLICDPVVAPTEASHLGSADRWGRRHGRTPFPVLATNSRETIGADRFAGSMLPTQNWNSTSCTRETGGRFCWHLSRSTVNGGQCNMKQAEWLTMSEPPRWRPSVQASLFGGAR